jgi:hypothetical protein
LKQGVKPGFARNTLLLSELDRDVVEYVRVQAQTTHKSHVKGTGVYFPSTGNY